MTQPVFSIVTVAREGDERLRGAIESVLAQEECGAIEHIIIDVGSSESIVDIAQEFSHIHLVRKEGASLSRALNAGFAIARGEIAACLDESDRYARGAFALVAREITRHPIVMGACGVCDDRGGVLSRIDNIERTWFDSIKYWVAQAVPTSSSVFFKRAILTELRIESGEVFDESLHSAMDFDLWLRLQESYPFSLSVPEVLAYRPQSAMVSRSVELAAQQAEMSRVFKRHASRRVQPEQSLSFVVPLKGDLGDAERFLDRLVAQTLPSLEVVCVDISGDRDVSREVANRIRARSARDRVVACQYVSLSADGGRTLAAAYDAGVRSARSHLVACVDPARDLPESFAADAFRCFARDEIGLVLPSLDNLTATKLFFDKHGTRVFNPAAPFSLTPGARLECVVRKLAWLDSGGFSLHERFPDLEFSMKRLMVMLAHKAWRITSEPLLSPLPLVRDHTEEPFRLYENSVVVDELARELRRNPFSVLRAKIGYGLVLPEDLWRAAQAVVRAMPQDGNASLIELESEALREVAERNPAYGPALFCLAEALAREGKVEDADRVRSKWREIHAGERSSALFGGVSS